jgi:putative Holliday junction resolvase
VTALAPSPRHSIYLAFDYGARRIGVAVGDDLTRSARPLATIANAQAPDWNAIEREMKSWKPSACIVGLPLDLDGNEQAITQQARAFAKALGDRYAIPVHLADERLSSRAATDELRNARASGRMTRRVRSGDRDQQAARLILEQWLAGAHR